METIKSIFEILNSNLGGLFVLALVGYALIKFGEFKPVFSRMPDLVDDVHQLKNDVAQLKGDIAQIKQKLGV